MKKVLLLIALVSLSIVTYAQQAKFVTLRVMHESQKSDTPNAEATTSFGVAGGVGMLLNDNWSVAMEAGYSTGSNNSNTIILKPSARYTWWLTKQIGVFTALGFPYITTTAENKSVETKTLSYGASMMPGLMVFPFKRIAFDLTFESMNYMKTDVSVGGVEDKASSATKFNIGFAGFGSPSVTAYYVF